MCARDARSQTGRSGEELAADFLRTQGFTIRETNVRSRKGEIDIVAQKNGRYHFVEVKTRSSTRFGTAKESVSPSKLRTIMLLARTYMSRGARSDKSWQIDLIAIQIDRLAGTTKIEHIENLV